MELLPYELVARPAYVRVTSDYLHHRCLPVECLVRSCNGVCYDPAGCDPKWSVIELNVDTTPTGRLGEQLNLQGTTEDFYIALKRRQLEQTETVVRDPTGSLGAVGVVVRVTCNDPELTGGHFLFRLLVAYTHLLLDFGLEREHPEDCPLPVQLLVAPERRAAVARLCGLFSVGAGSGTNTDRLEALVRLYQGQVIV